MKTEEPKGRNHRCGDHPHVGGVPTEAGETTWQRRCGTVERVRSPRQVAGAAELLVVPARLGAPDPAWFDGEDGRPDGVWSGVATAASMRRSGRDLDERARTLARHPHLAGRCGPAPLGRPGPVDPLAGSEDAAVVLHLAAEVRRRGGRALVVGGAVRDALWAARRGEVAVPKDVDVEVFGVPEDELGEVLAGVGGRGAGTVGASFAVYTLGDVDVSLPRTERKTGAGYRGFEVSADHTMAPERACLRRDFTVNAVMYDPLTGELVDHVGGAADLAAGVLRHVSDAFAEDPLRVLRGAQFVARFDLRADAATKDLCASLVGEAATLAPERVFDEFAKLLVKGHRPAAGLEFLADTGWTSLWPELEAVRDPGALDRWAAGRGADPLVRGLAVLGRQLAEDPDEAAAALAALVGSWGDRPREARAAAALVRLADDVAAVAAAGCSDAAVRDLAHRAGGCAAVCDVARGTDPAAARTVAAAAAHLGVLEAPEAPWVGGDDLVAAGRRPGRAFKAALDAAYRAQAARSAADAAAALRVALDVLDAAATAD